MCPPQTFFKALQFQPIKRQSLPVGFSLPVPLVFWMTCLFATFSQLLISPAKKFVIVPIATLQAQEIMVFSFRLRPLQ
jgi:hypothetical protein